MFLYLSAQSYADLVDDVFEDDIILSKGWIKQVIFNRDWTEPSAKIQIVSRVKKGQICFFRIYDGLDNTAQCCVEDAEVVNLLDEIPDNSVIEVVEADLLMGSRIIFKKLHLLKTLGKPLSDNLDQNFLNKQFFIDYFQSKGIFRKDESVIRQDCPEYQPSPIKMKTRSSRQPRDLHFSSEEALFEDCQEENCL